MFFPRDEWEDGQGNMAHDSSLSLELKICLVEGIASERPNPAPVRL